MQIAYEYKVANGYKVTEGIMERLLEGILEDLDFKGKDAEQYPPLVLAYIGDAVYEVFIRTLLVCSDTKSVHTMHKRSVDFVKAKAQSDIIHRISESLSAEEQDIVRRGRNAKSGTIPKNADVTEYKYATGFEALIGYLYLKRDIKRLIQVMKMAIIQ